MPGAGILDAPPQQAIAGVALGGAQRRVGGDVHAQDEALLLAVERDKADARLACIPGAPEWTRGHEFGSPGQLAARELNRAGRRLVGTEQGADELAAARAEQAEDAHDLAGPHIEADVPEGGSELRPLTRIRVPRRCGVLARVHLLEVAPDHGAHEVVPRVDLRIEEAADATVTQHQGAVGDLEDLRQAMRDVDDRRRRFA